MPNNALGMRVLTNTATQLKTVDRAFASGVRKNLRAGIQAAGAGVLGRVRSNASWSSRIPAATALSIRYNVKGASVRIQVNHTKAPHARPLELGNKNVFVQSFLESHGGTGTVNGRKRAISHSAYAAARQAGAFGKVLRHPVFHKIGDTGGFAEEQLRPFFFPAIKSSGRDIDLQMEKVVVQTARDAGFR
jgi:hypothetical protein